LTSIEKYAIYPILKNTKIKSSLWETITRLNRHPQNGKKIFASYTFDKGIITRIYREIKKLNSQKFNDPMKKWAKELNRAFSKEEI
jgi:hypothetical protein